MPEPLSATATAALRRDLEASVDGEVRFDAGSRAAYSTDASNFRQVPIGVVVPRTLEAAEGAVAVCHRHRTPLLSRGGGTSLAGQCCNAAVVIDWSRYCHRLVAVDPQARTCVVEPGIVLDVLNRQLAEHGLEYGPEPATHYNCTLGGMIGNNSCGATAQRTGKVVDNVARLEVLLHDGTRFWCGPTSDAEYAEIVAAGGRRAEVYRQLRELREDYVGRIRTGYPPIPRRVSGYNLDSLLPEKGFDVAGALVGSESTLVTVLRAELKLVPVVSHRTLVVLGYPSVAAAADAVPEVVAHGPIALEGLDDRLIGFERRKRMNAAALELLPEGRGWLLAQFGGETKDEADKAAHGLLDALAEADEAPAATVYDDPDREKELWTVRESGLGATAHVPGEAETFPGWEDAAVAPDRLGDYLRDLRGLYDEFGYGQASVYGHFGQGCVHSRIPFDLYGPEGVAAYRRFLERAARLVTRYGGSLSGEHGDGQQRGELLSTMFGEELVAAFRRFKAIFDPDNLMNPGKVVDPAPLDANLRLGPSWHPMPSSGLHFSYPDDDGSFVKAANRCVGVGKCRQHDHSGATVMCPSYQVTREEKHATRGRARLLFEMLDGHGDGPLSDGWRSDAVFEALDLCLACKGCKSDCPVDVDMATYKAEFLAHYWKGRLRPRADYSMGWLPLAAQVIGRLRAGPLVNALTGTPGLARAATFLAGVDPRRQVPRFSAQTLQQWFAARSPGGDGHRGEVLLWPDTFTAHLHPHVGQAAVEVLEDAGWRVLMPRQPLCCGLTWISTGQLDIAKRVLRRTVDALAEHVRAGGLVVGLEPSCTAVFRADMRELLPDDQDALRLAGHIVTLAELLREHTDGWRPPRLERTVIAQAHCHQHAVLGFEHDMALLRDMGADAEHLASGCCGLAGNFGFQPGHFEVSRDCAEQVLLPRVRAADPDTVVLADGFSCRTQVEQLDSGGRAAIHLAELLNAARRGERALGPLERVAAPRAAPPSLRAQVLAAIGTAATAVLAAAGVAALARRR